MVLEKLFNRFKKTKGVDVLSVWSSLCSLLCWALIAVVLITDLPLQKPDRTVEYIRDLL